MQEITPSQLAAAMPNVGDTTALTDSRDGQEYTVGKLADGKYWMLDNLALDVVAKIDNMNETNTNASSTSLGYLKNGGGSTTDGDSTYKYASAGVSYWTSSYSYSAPLIAKKNVNNDDWNPSTVPSDTISQSGGYKVGIYYNYCAATAGSYCYGNGTSAGTSTGDATDDLCPKGWRMPTGNTSGEFSALANAIYGSTEYTNDPTAYANYRTALHLPLSGRFSDGSAINQDNIGYWWSSKRYDNDIIYGLRTDTSGIFPASSYGRFDGFSLRCLFSGQ